MTRLKGKINAFTAITEPPCENPYLFILKTSNWGVLGAKCWGMPKDISVWVNVAHPHHNINLQRLVDWSFQLLSP